MNEETFCDWDCENCELSTYYSGATYLQSLERNASLGCPAAISELEQYEREKYE